MLVVTELEQLPVREARAGDAAAWNALFKRYQLPLYTYVFELIHHEQASLDIVQESVHQRRPAYRRFAPGRQVRFLALRHCPPKMRAILAQAATGKFSDG